MERNTMVFGFTFDSDNPNWNSTPEYNIMFFRAQLAYLNEQLRSLPFLTVNDVFEALGVERSVSGMVYGWDQDDTINFVLNHQDGGWVQVSFTASNIYEEMNR